MASKTLGQKFSTKFPNTTPPNPLRLIKLHKNPPSGSRAVSRERTDIRTLVLANRSSANTSKNEVDFIFIISSVRHVWEFDTVAG